MRTNESVGRLRNLLAPTLLAPTLLASLATSHLAMPANADITNAFYASSNNYHYRVIHMPDLDQRRSTSATHPGLPGNGSMYCVPTSTTNLFAYAANHGFPFVAPGPGNWRSNILYDDATSTILTLGVLMNTTASGGTTNGGWSSGSNLWTSAESGGLLTRSTFFLSSGYDVRAFRLAQKAAQGSIVAFAYGRYDVVGTVGGLPVVVRDGGHAVTLTRIQNTGNGTTIKYRDPADAPTNDSQGDFKNKVVSGSAVTVALGVPRTLSAIAYPSSDGKIRIIDAFVTLKPIYGIGFSNSDGLVLQPVAPLAFEGSSNPAIPVANAFAMRDMHIDADGSDAIVIVQPSPTNGQTQMRRINTMTGEQTPLSTFNSLESCCVDRSGRIYAHDGAKLYALNADGTSTGLASSTIPSPTALASDDKNDHILVLSVAEKKVQRLNRNLGVISTYSINPLLFLSGEGSIAAHPTANRSYFTVDSSNAIYELIGTGPFFSFNTISIPGLVSPRSISIGDDGALYVVSGGLVKVLRESRGAWAIDTTSPFHNAPSSGRFQVSRSRTNYDPAEHDTPGWNFNIDPDELLNLGFDEADCDTDLNGDDQTNAADLAKLLGDWNAAGGVADINQDGVVNAADLAILLGEWGPCLP
jgi:hypothetical protein